MTNLQQEAGKQVQDRKMRDSEGQDATATNSSAWTPLRVPLFRDFWVATLFANSGTFGVRQPVVVLQMFRTLKPRH